VSILLIFITINFLILFLVKTRTTTVTSLIIAHLVVILFFSVSIANYNLFKEITLALIVYSMVILFLISNYDEFDFGEKNKTPRRHLMIIFLPLIFVAFTTFFAVVKNIARFSEIVAEKKMSLQEEVMLNPMILPSHPAHIAVKQFYFGKKFEDDLSDKVSIALENNDRKRARLKDKLSDNFLLKRSSDVILIIVAVSSGLLLMSNKKSDESI